MGKAIIQIDIDIVEADSKATDSNDPIDRAYWRNRTLLMQSEKLTLRNIQNNIFAKETERERKEMERERKEADKVDGLIRLGKIGDSTILCSVSKY